MPDAVIRRHRITVSGRRVVYREAGAGVPVILASGLGLSGRFYDLNLPVLAAAGLHAIVPDLPGFGGTGGRGHRTGQTPQQTCDFLLEFAAAVGIERAFWIGHSVGAQAVLALAGQAPHRVHGLVLVGPTGDPAGSKAWQQARALALETLRAPPRVVLRVFTDYARTSPLAYLGTWVRYAMDHTEDDLARVQCPVLVLVGTRDPVVRTSYLELLQRRIPCTRLERVPGGTHALPRSSPAAFNQATIAFCRDTTRPPAGPA